MSNRANDEKGAGAQQPNRYHHGDLKAALLHATDELLAERGLEGFSLREVARRAGVSPAAPAHHFGSATGLLSEVATLAFAALADRLTAPNQMLSPTALLHWQGSRYVQFALEYPGRFQLMFRRELLSDEHVGLKQAGDRALAQLEQTVRSIRAIPTEQPLDEAASALLLATWSMVHGFAHLVLDGKLTHMHPGATQDELIERMLPAMLQSQWPAA